MPRATLGVFSAMALGTFSSAAFANESSMRVSVPFAFVVAGQQFGPGEYVVTQNDVGLITVQGAGKGAMVISSPAAAAIATGGSSLVFTNSKAQLNLTTVAEEGEATRSIPVRHVEQRTLTMSSH